MKVLLVGGAGQVAQNLVKSIPAWDFRALDAVPSSPGVADSLLGDVADLDTLVTASCGMDAIVHLTHGGGNSAPWSNTLPVDYIGTYNIFEAAARNGVARVVFASRAGIMGGSNEGAPYPPDRTRTVEMLPKPVGYYSVAKVFGEALGYHYAATTGMSVVCIRIGNFKATRSEPDHPHALGHADCAALFFQAVTYPLAVRP